MNETILQKLTIVIFSYNRHKYLKRTIKYWSDYDVKLLVLDGSDSRLADSCLSSKKIKYIHDQVSLYSRLSRSADYINTEFMILGSDDEFYLPSALTSCINFLSEEKEYSSCQGLAIGFGTRKQGKDVFGNQMYIELKDLCLSLDKGNVSERITRHFSNYIPAHVYSVIRSNKFKIICRYIFEREYNFSAAWELQMELLTMASGKNKVIKELMWMRNMEVPTIRGTSPSMSHDNILDDWWHKNYYKKQKDDFLYRMSRACNELSSNKHFKFTEDIVASFIECYLYKSKKKFRKFRKFIIKIKIKMIEVLKFLTPYIPWHEIKFKGYKKLKDETYKLEALGYQVNNRDVDKVIVTLID